MDANALFFLALLPGSPVEREVTAFKEVCAQLFQASHALKSPPHITLIPPFRWPSQQLPVLAGALQDFAARQKSFDITLRGFNCFEPGVIFVDVVENQQLKMLQSGLFHFLQQAFGLPDERGKRFHPHMTIAHRDLKPTVFPKAWEHFSNLDYQRTFSVDRLTLLEHAERMWQAREEFYF